MKLVRGVETGKQGGAAFLSRRCPALPVPDRGLLCACLASSVLLGVNSILFNGVLNEVQRNFSDATRDWATWVQAALMVLLALVSRHQPRAIRPVPFTVLSLVALVVGTALVWAGVAGERVGLVVTGTCLTSSSLVWASVVWIVLCSALPFRWMLACFAAGDLLSAPVGALVSLGGYHAGLVGYAAMIAAALAGCTVLTRGAFDSFASAESAADAEVTRPRSILPLTHDLFIYIFVFCLAYGFALRYEGADGGLLINWLIVVLEAAIAVYALASRRGPRADVIFDAAFILLTCGFLLVLLDDARFVEPAATVLLSSNAVFCVLMSLALGAVAARGRSNVVPAIAWGYAAYYVGIGVGAQVGMFATCLPAELHLAAKVVVALILLAVMMYTLLSIRDFGFDKTIAAVEPDAGTAPAAEVLLADRVEARCDELVAQLGLTERESDVFRLLVRGNNTLRIQEELAITKNTLKYHVRHIYEKAGVHSQQELIDLL